MFVMFVSHHNWPGGNESILKRPFSLSIYQMNRTMGPKEMGISPGISYWRRDGHQPEGKLVSQKEISHHSNNWTEHFKDEAEARSWWDNDGQ